MVTSGFSGCFLRMGPFGPGHRGVLLGCRPRDGALIMQGLVYYGGEGRVKGLWVKDRGQGWTVFD